MNGPATLQIHIREEDTAVLEQLDAKAIAVARRVLFQKTAAAHAVDNAMRRALGH
jgi:hypothetical protein